MSEQAHPKSHGGKRADLNDQYFRSTWEANYARYLNWLKKIGEIIDWKFEPDTFEFVPIKKGNRFYTPDFKIFNKDGSYEYHEVKGWMDSDSATKLKRMNKYYPKIKVVVVDQPAYYAIARQVSGFIPEWERNAKKHKW